MSVSLHLTKSAPAAKKGQRRTPDLIAPLWQTPSTGKYNDTRLYRPKDWEFLRTKQRVMNIVNDAPMHLRATDGPDSFFKTLNDVLVVIQAEMISWDRYDATEGKT